tara:strand:+ start:474 stop:650 length:177 start_codon:yes stop_codon:yes gene_type:complete
MLPSSSFKNLIPKFHPKKPTKAKNRLLKIIPLLINVVKPNIIPKMKVNISKLILKMKI